MGGMRLWSLHPRHLDRQGLTAGWREALLAQAVLAGRTKGYRSHPQLDRFRATGRPDAAVGAYLAAIADEADARGYRYDRARIDHPPTPDAAVARLDVTDGQLAFEWTHLLAKLQRRSPDAWRAAQALGGPAPHPLFVVVPGPVAEWERAAA